MSCDFGSDGHISIQPSMSHLYHQRNVRDPDLYRMEQELRARTENALTVAERIRGGNSSSRASRNGPTSPLTASYTNLMAHDTASRNPNRVQQIDAELRKGSASAEELRQYHTELQQALATLGPPMHWNMHTQPHHQQVVPQIHYLLAQIDQLLFAQPKKVPMTQYPAMANVIRQAGSWYQPSVIQVHQSAPPPVPKITKAFRVKPDPQPVVLAPEPEVVYVVLPDPAPVVIEPIKPR